MAWTDLSSAFSYGSKLTSAQMQNLRDNITALANGDSGAPRIQTSAVDSGAITVDQMEYNAGDTRLIGGGTSNAYYEVLDSEGVWDQSCGVFDDSI